MLVHMFEQPACIRNFIFNFNDLNVKLLKHFLSRYQARASENYCIR